MADDFDPYYTWLGIPPEDQPPDHYRLLGVRRFEANADVITNAMDQRMHYLRSLQVGKRSALSQKILNEVSSAGVILLDPQKRTDYDQQLRAKEEKKRAAAPAASTPVPARTARPLPVASSLPKAAPLSGAQGAAASSPAASSSAGPSADVVITSAASAAGPARRQRPLWNSPAVLGGVAFSGVAALGLIGMLVVWWLQKPPAPNPVPAGPKVIVDQGTKKPKVVVTPEKGNGLKPSTGTTGVKTNETVQVHPWWDEDASRARLNVLEFDQRASAVVGQTANVVSLAQHTTIEGWFKLRLDTPRTMLLFGTRSVGTAGQPPQGWAVMARRGPVNGTMSDQLAVELWKNSRQIVVHTANLPEPSRWHHLALVAVAGKELLLFIDGRPAIRAPTEPDLSASGADLRIGDDGRGGGLEGQVCGLRICDTARYTQPFTPSPPLQLTHDQPAAVVLNFTIAVPNAAVGSVRRKVEEWKYGHGDFDEAAKKTASFTPMMEFTGLQWKPGPSLPENVREWISLDPLGGHTGNGEQYAVIRRWTAPADGSLAIAGQLTHAHETKFGDGILGRVVSSASGEAGQWDARFAAVETAVEKLEVKKGDTVDFLVECKSGNHCDKFAWPVKLTLSDAEGKSLGTWDSEQDFQGASGLGAVHQLARLSGAKWQRLEPGAEVAMTMLAPIPGAPSAVAARVNLIEQYGTQIQPMRGSVLRTPAGALVIPQPTATAFTMPVDFPAEYVLRAEVTRTSGDESICFGFPIRDGRLTAIVDGMKGTVSGFAAVNGRQIFAKDNPLVHQGGLLTNGRRAEIQVEVRNSGARLIVDGRTVSDWQAAPGEQTASAKGMGFPTTASLAVMTWNSPYQIDRLELIPLQPASAAPPPASSGGRVELVKKHGSRIIKTRGTVAYSEAEGWVTASTGTSFTILESMPREYVIEADVIREDGAGSISFFLPVEGKTLSAIVDIYDSRLTGLSDINDWNIQSGDNPTVHRGPVLKNGEPARIRVVVSRQEISLSVDGNKLSSWPYDPAARLVAYQGLRLPDTSKLGITTGNSKFRIQRVELISGQGAGSSTPLAAGVPIDLIDDQPNVVRPMAGGVRIEDDAVTTDGRRTQFVLERGQLPDEYVLEGEVTRESGSETVGFGLLAQGRPFSVLIDAWNSNRTGICFVPGQDANIPGGPSIHQGRTLTNGQAAKFRIVVDRKEVVLEIDGKLTARWDNDPQAQLQPFRGYEPRDGKLTVATWFSTTYRIANLRLTPKGGSSSPAGDSPAGFAAKRNPLPDAAAKAKAQTQITAVFGEELKGAKLPPAKATVARKISELAIETKDLATKYVMLEQAQQLFVELKDVASAMQTVDAIAQDFEISPLSEKARLLGAMAAGALSSAQRADLVAEGCGLGYEAIDSDQFEIAKSLADVVRTASSRTTGDVRAEAQAFAEEFSSLSKRWDAVGKAEKTLAQSPDDPAANLTLGLYYTFERGDGAKGLPMLAKGSDAKLAAAAQARQKTVQSGVAGSVDEASAWYDCLATAPADYKTALQKQALDALELALPSVQGLEKARLTKLRDELKAQLASTSSPATGAKRGPRVRKSDLPESAPGMIGRVFLGGKDAGILITFRPTPTGMDTQKLRNLLTEAKVPGGRIVLEGVISCITPMSMRLSHRGASTAATQQILVNGRNFSRVGGGSGQYDNERLQLAPGKHRIQWIVDFDGSTGPEFYIYEDGNGQPISLTHSRDQAYAARKLNTTSEIDLNDPRFGN